MTTVKTKVISVWKDANYLKAYQLAKAGNKDKQIAAALGVTINTYNGWLQSKPALREAVDEGRKDAGDGKFLEYVHERLPEDLQETWHLILDMDEKKASPETVKELLAHHGVKARQILFVHALVHCNFNRSAACRLLGITTKMVEKWIDRDEAFQEMVKAVFQAKKDLFEESLVKLVKAGETAAVLFANRTLNKDRGYGNKVEVEVTGGVDHVHKHVGVEELGLTVAERKKLLAALRARQDPKALPCHDDVEDADYEVKD